MKATKVNTGLAESNGRLLLGIWRDSLHVTCGLTACTPGSALGPTLGNDYGKTLPFTYVNKLTYLLTAQGRQDESERAREHNRTTAMLLAVVGLFQLTELPQGVQPASPLPSCEPR